MTPSGGRQVREVPTIFFYNTEAARKLGCPRTSGSHLISWKSEARKQCVFSRKHRNEKGLKLKEESSRLSQWRLRSKQNQCASKQAIWRSLSRNITLWKLGNKIQQEDVTYLPESTKMWCGLSLGPMMSLSEKDISRDSLMTFLRTAQGSKMEGPRQTSRVSSPECTEIWCVMKSCGNRLKGNSDISGMSKTSAEMIWRQLMRSLTLRKSEVRRQKHRCHVLSGKYGNVILLKF